MHTLTDPTEPRPSAQKETSIAVKLAAHEEAASVTASHTIVSYGKRVVLRVGLEHHTKDREGACWTGKSEKKM